MTIEALIFDVDGTLADTEELHRTAFNQAFAHFGLGWVWDKPAYRQLLDTTGGKERMAAYLDRLALPEAEHRHLLGLLPDIHAHKTGIYSAAINDGTLPLRDGVRRLIDEALAAGCRLAIASTTTAANIDALLGSTIGAHGADIFGVIACGDEVQAKKPAPDIYEMALRRLGVPATRAVAFEDSAHGLRAAQAAGLWTVVTPTCWTEDGDLQAADLLLPSLGDPGKPLPDEPGRRLRRAAWLGFDELSQLAGRRPRVEQLHALVNVE